MHQLSQQLNKKIRPLTLEQFLQIGGVIKRCPTAYAIGSNTYQGKPISPEDAEILQSREKSKQIKRIPKKGWAVYWAYRKLRAAS